MRHARTWERGHACAADASTPERHPSGPHLPRLGDQQVVHGGQQGEYLGPRPRLRCQALGQQGLQGLQAARTTRAAIHPHTPRDGLPVLLRHLQHALAQQAGQAAPDAWKRHPIRSRAALAQHNRRLTVSGQPMEGRRATSQQLVQEATHHVHVRRGGGHRARLGTAGTHLRGAPLRGSPRQGKPRARKQVCVCVCAQQQLLRNAGSGG